VTARFGSPNLASAVAACTFAAVASGCIGAPDERTEPESNAETATASQPRETASTEAWIVVERTTGPTESHPSSAVIARFVRARGSAAINETARDAAGVSPVLPALGECNVPGSAASPRAGVRGDGDGVFAAPLHFGAGVASPSHRDHRGHLDRGAVELLDVGRMFVGAPAETDASSTDSFELTARALPDPTGLVTGVVYSTHYVPTSFAAMGSGRKPITLRVEGRSADVGGVLTEAPTPPDITNVHAKRTESGLAIAWSRASTMSDTPPIILIEHRSTNGRVLRRCVCEDSGTFVLRDRAFGAASEHADAHAHDGEVWVHRIHRHAFVARGIQRGELRFDVARIVGIER